MIVKSNIPTLTLVVALSLAAPAFGHSGRTNSKGCHQDSSTGNSRVHLKFVKTSRGQK
ncbi:YHYH domain-containing protein [Spirulina sp. 06S082]|uniref:YHYH domain-containing protein n=1 Tax=Spirulina sp. 06S082 TaxID=3110248 RepID=UPI003A4D8369